MARYCNDSERSLLIRTIFYLRNCKISSSAWSRRRGRGLKQKKTFSQQTQSNPVFLALFLVWRTTHGSWIWCAQWKIIHALLTWYVVGWVNEYTCSPHQSVIYALPTHFSFQNVPTMRRCYARCLTRSRQSLTTILRPASLLLCRVERRTQPVCC